MKKIEVDNKLTKVIALLLITCVAIGLVSSTAIKLAATTYFMQNNKKPVTNIPFVDNMIDDAINNVQPTQAPTQAPATQAPTTQPATQAPTTQPATKAPETQAPTTQAPTTQAPTTQAATQAPTQAPETEAESETDSPKQIKQKKTVLKKYSALVNKAKKGNAGYTRVTYRGFETGVLDDIMLGSVESAYPEYFVSEGTARENPTVVALGTKTNDFLIDNMNSAALLDVEDASAAIQSATSVKLEDGTKKIVITLREEVEPEPLSLTATKASSFTSALFPVVSKDDVAEMVAATLSITSVSSSTVKYHDCTVELIYNPENNQIISVTQSVKYTGEVKGMILTCAGVVDEVNEYTDFIYA